MLITYSCAKCGKKLTIEKWVIDKLLHGYMPKNCKSCSNKPKA